MSADAILNGQSPIDIENRHGGGAYRPAPVTMVRGDGAYLYDADGNAYLDFNTGIGVAALGHAHPAIVEAVSKQAETLVTCSAGYVHNDVRARFTAKLAEIAPEGLERVFLVNSGSEAIESALKLARAHTGRPKIIASERGFHGRTLGALSATHKRPYRQPFHPLVPEFAHVPFGDVEALQDVVDERTAAVLLEPIQGEAGIYPAPEGYLQAARDVCDAHGALLIFDEIQSGMGRTGRWFACEHDDVVPDALCLAKPLGGGVPLGATVFREDVAFGKGQHGSTFGGNPLACRTGLAFVETIENEDRLEHVAEIGTYLRQGLEEIATDRPEQCREVRGHGLMLALQLRGKAGPLLRTLLMDHQLLVLAAGSTALRLLPPYTITRGEADQALGALAEALG